MTADAAATRDATRDAYTDSGELHGVWTRGAAPKELVLSDGSRLELAEPEQGHARWRRSDERGHREDGLSARRARELAGDEFSDYVEVRTRSEAEWLRAVADWCRSEAERLESELR